MNKKILFACWLPWIITIMPEENSTQHHQLIIVGLGPAGLTAAIYAGRAKIKPLVIGNESLLATVPVIENWPGTQKISGAELIERFATHAKAVGAECLNDEVDTLDLSHTPFIVHTQQGKTFTADALILATGMTHKKIGCPGEREYWTKGVCNCAICDAPLYNKKPVIIVGGGMAALQNAQWLHKYASSIAIVNRDAAFSAPKKIVADVLKYPTVKAYHNCEPTMIVGDENHVTRAHIRNNVSGETFTLPTNGVFVSIGYEPCTQLFKDRLPINEEGQIIASPVGLTPIPGVFVAGKAANVPNGQIVHCVASGCSAAISAAHYLEAKRGTKVRRRMFLSCQRDNNA